MARRSKRCPNCNRVMRRLYISIENQPTGIGWVCPQWGHGPGEQLTYSEIDKDFNWVGIAEERGMKRVRHEKAIRTDPYHLFGNSYLYNPRKMYITNKGHWKPVGWFSILDLKHQLDKNFEDELREEKRRELRRLGVAEFCNP